MKYTIRESNYIKLVIGWHVGFLLFIFLYTAIGITMEEIMGTMTPKKNYDMSGLLIVTIDMFGAYFAGCFEGLCFVFYVKQKWKAILRNCLICSISLLIIYMLLLGIYSALHNVSGRALIPIDRVLQKAVRMTEKASRHRLRWHGCYGRNRGLFRFRERKELRAFRKI